MIICIVGMPASGKSLAAGVIGRMGFKTIEMGSIVKEMLKKSGKEASNQNLREYAIKIRKQYGRDVVARLTAKRIGNEKGNLLIVGVRNKEELDYFRKKFKDISVVLITSPARVRYSRIKARKRPDDPKNFKEFIYREKKETLLGIKGAISGADYIISNAGDIATFKKDIKALVIRILKERQ